MDLTFTGRGLQVTDEVRETEAYFALITEVREALRAGGGNTTDQEAAASTRRTMAEGAVG